MLVDEQRLAEALREQACDERQLVAIECHDIALDMEHDRLFLGRDFLDPDVGADLFVGDQHVVCLNALREKPRKGIELACGVIAAYDELERQRRASRIVRQRADLRIADEHRSQELDACLLLLFAAL